MLNEVRSLLVRLTEADAAWQREKARALAWRLVPYFLGGLAGAITLDAFLQLSSPPRLLLLGAGVLAGTAAAAVVAWVAWRRHNPPERTARHLEQRDPALGSRLINALQLADQAGDASVSELTRRLAARAVQGYVDGLRDLDLRVLARTDAARRRRRIAARALGVFALLVAAFYPVTSMVLPRLLDPLGDHPPYALTRVELVHPGEEGVEVVYGASLKVKARWSGHEPRELFLTVQPADHTQGAVTLPMVREGERGFSQEVPDVREDLVVVAHSRSRNFHSRHHPIRVVLTPRIEKGFLQVAPPGYTGLPPEERPFGFSSASALEGSRLRFRLRSNRPLREGIVEVLRADDQAERYPLELVGTHEVAGGFALAGSSRVRFRVTDVDGLPSEPTAEGLVTATVDLPPVVHLAEPAQDGFVAQDYVLPLRVEATDDYGVRTVRLHRGLNGSYPEPGILTIEGVQRDVGHKESVDLAALGVKSGDRLSFFAEAIDTCPEPHLARSRTVTLRVVSPSEYNDFLREERDVRDLAAKYEEALRQFRELREDQARLATEMEAVSRRAASGDTNALAPGDVDRLMARQNEVNQRLEQQARVLDELVRPDPLYDFEKDLQRQLAEQTARIRASTATNRAAMNRLAEATSPAGGPRSITPGTLSAMEREAREHAERLGARDKDLARNVAQPLEDLSRLHDLVNDFNAFQQLYEAQKELAEQAAAYEKRSPLKREDQLALEELASREQAVREALEELPALLRQHAREAEARFPKAATSGRGLAESLEQARLAPLASQATERMLEADGERSAQLARRLEKDMGRLFAQCQGNGPGEPGNELDQFLRLTLGGGQKQSLEQMKQCRKFGLSPGLLPRLGQGRGAGQGSGYSQTTGPELAVLGNERLAQRGPKESSSRPGAGQQGSSGGLAGADGLAAGKGDVLRGLNPADRQSAAIPSEGTIDAYQSVVDEYFKALTRKP